MFRIGIFLFLLGFIPVMSQGAEEKTVKGSAEEMTVKGSAEEMTVKGRVVDAKCHLTMDMTGPSHAECAAKCIQNGHPAALLADTTGQLFFFIFEDPVKGKEQLVKFAEKRVEVKGKVYFEAHAIVVTSISEIKVPADKK